MEPSADMLRVLAARLAAAGPGRRCDLRQATFEDVDPGEVCDTAGPAVVAAACGRTRALGLEQLGSRPPAGAHDLAAVRRLYSTSGQRLRPDVDDGRAGTGWAESEIDTESGLELVDVRTSTWPWRLKVDDDLALLRTMSQYAVADVRTREALLVPVRDVLGDAVALYGTTRLLVVRSVT